MSERNPPLLEMDSISKTFGATKALSNVSLNVEKGEVHSLMGENGAGKSTLMKILSGAITADSGGRIAVEGHEIPTGDTRKSRDFGIAVIYQELSLAENLTVGQNLYLGREHSKFGLVGSTETRIEAEKILKGLGVTFGSDTRVASLSLGERQLVEIARALTSKARIIVMDEPTTSLTNRETEKLFQVIHSLKSEEIGIIYISHRMDEVYALSDRCSVLRDGEYIATLGKHELNAEKLISLMVGRDISTFYKKEHNARSQETQPLLQIKNLGDGRLLKDCSFNVFPGEVLGIAGLVGAGRTELLRLICGADKSVSGQVLVDGKPVRVTSPRHALRKGIAYLTEDRKNLGLFLNMSIRENINASVAQSETRIFGIYNFSSAAKRAKEAIEQLGIRASSASLNVGKLSGGNQQKVLISRLLATNPKVLMLDEPTRGVDVGAKSEIYRLIDNLAASGIAVIVVSSELPEIVGICDRCLVMREGEIVGQSSAGNQSLDQEELMRYATGNY